MKKSGKGHVKGGKVSVIGNLWKRQEEGECGKWKVESGKAAYS
jgi:hypothetical protein